MAGPNDINTHAVIHYARHTSLGAATGSVSVGKLNMWDAGSAYLRIDNGGSLTVDSSGSQDGVISMSGAGSVDVPGSSEWDARAGVINIETGGSLTSANTGSTRIVVTGDASQYGKINLNGGTFTAQGNSTSEALQLQRVEFNFNSGIFDLSGGQVWTNNVDFNIVGNGTSIQMDALNTGAGPANFNFSFVEGGNNLLSSINSTPFMHLSAATISVDGTNYSGGEQDLILFSAGNLASEPTVAATATNFDGLDASFQKVGQDYVLSLTAVPEPGATAFLTGIIALSWVVIRRRRRG